MKFVPRQPQPPPATPRSATTTRFLRLQPADDVTAETPRTEPRPLPAFPDRPVRQNRAASQRVRLRLDPAVASQPLPDAERLLLEPLLPAKAASVEQPSAVESAVLPDAPASEPAAPAMVEPVPDSYDPASYAITEAERVPTATAEESLFDAPAEPVPAAEPGSVAGAAIEPAPEVFEIPPSAETVEKVWVPPGPGHAGPSTWLPPVATRMLSASDIPRPASITARDHPEDETDAAPAAFLRRLPRPELRRPVVPLAQMAGKEQNSLGPGFWILLVLIVALLLAALYFFGIAPRIAAYQAQVSAARAVVPAAPARPVMFVLARQALPVTELPVTGTVEASRETPLYARTTGYVKDWLVDLGDKVQAGQVLAELDTPEIDHELTQARASADQAKAQVALAQNEADRWTKMAQDRAVSQSDADAKTATLNEAQANFNAAEANVGRLADLEMFKQIRAPYAGTITARNLEVGTLVGAGPGPSGSELFRVTQTDPVRVFVDVPEASAPAIHAGVEAKVQVAAYPGRVFAGAVVRDAGALDATSHTLRTEVHVSNPDGTLLPGTLASVKLQLIDSTPALLAPSSSLIMSPAGAAIARLTSSDGREVVRMVPVRIGRIFGDDVELLGNLVNPGDRLVANPPADLQDGMVVSAQPYEAPVLPALMPPHPSAPRI
jgi:RND family efflux transporter MFP subunit